MMATQALTRPIAATWDSLFKGRTNLWDVRHGRNPSERHLGDLITRLRARLLAPPATTERMQAVFFDKRRTFLGETALGEGRAGALSLRHRDIFAQALSLRADSMILAHNHPSGICKPSRIDIEATQRIATLARALDIELVDHLIFTETAVYSMRGNGEL